MYGRRTRFYAEKRRRASGDSRSVDWRNGLCRVVWLGAALLTGCSNRPARVEPPDLDPAAAATEALATFDTNADGGLDDNELTSCPGLKAATRAADTDRDGKLSAEEIAARIEAWSAGRVAVVAVNCTVVRNGQPLPSATVTFVPEKFLGENIASASGVSDSTGRVELAVAGVPITAAAYCGFYRVEISRKEGDKELIPAKFNRETVLGEEITEGDKRRVEGLVFDVSGR